MAIEFIMFGGHLARNGTSREFGAVIKMNAEKDEWFMARSLKNITIPAIGVVLHIGWVRVLRSHGCRRGVNSSVTRLLPKGTQQKGKFS